jgi:RNA polymerase sigma-70 factor (ECF subfamily)
LLSPLADEQDEDSIVFQAGGDLCALDDLTRAETIETVRRAVLSLPPKYREVVVLCELQDVSYVETAEILGCAIGTVRSRLHRARALLLSKLRPAENVTDDADSASVKSARCFA